MARNRILYAISGDVAVLVVPHRDKWFRCYIDAADLALIRSSCTAFHVRLASNGTPYVCASVGGEPVYLHRFLLGLSSGDDRVGDHINGNTLDYRRKNLRSVSPALNSYNRKGATSRSVSGIRGVRKTGKKWLANLKLRDSENFYLGVFESQQDAALAVLKRLAAIDVVSAKRYVSSLPAGFFDRHPARLPEEAA